MRENYDLEKRNVYQHRLQPNGNTLWDEECKGCTSFKMMDSWHEFLSIDKSILRKTLNVKKLEYVIETIKREAAFTSTTK